MDLATPRITLDSLQPLTGIATASFLTAAEKLAVALSRERFVVIKLPQHMADVLKPALEKLLAAETRSLPGCNVREWRVGGRGNAPDIELVGAAFCALGAAPMNCIILPLRSPSLHQPQAHNVMESVARVVLSALCRSSMLRLRCDAFSPLLDDLPLTRSAPGSSRMEATVCSDNFSQLAAENGKVFADPQVGAAAVLSCADVGAPLRRRLGP